MPLPATIRVKLSSEVAESISITPVVVRDIPVRELVEHMLGVTGKDEARVHELLRRGTLVSGASRFRWPGWDADRAGIAETLATFPDPAPELPFAAERCVRAVLRGGGRRIEIPRDVGTRKPLLRRTSFWDVLMAVAAETKPRYVDYSYRDRADWYSGPLPPGSIARLRDAARLVKYTTLRSHIRTSNLEEADWFITRV